MSLLPFVPALLILAATAPHKPFSHKYHLTQVAACENCHTSAAASTKAEDDLIPDKSACATCHDEIEIGAVKPIGVQKFNHAKHVEMGSISPLVAAAVKAKTYTGAAAPSAETLAAARDACSGCHRGILSSEDVPHGKATPAHFPAMADCLVCHNKINPPESCKQCHVAPSSGFRPTSHVAGFEEKHSDKALDKTACATCHGRKFTCKNCH